MVHRDEVHGDVRFDRVAVALLDTGALQRLGRVAQLGFAPLVYRSGNHTRLSHVMGAYHAAGRLVEALRRNYEGETGAPQGAVKPALFLPKAGTIKIEDRWSMLKHLVGWAALLHDVGHVPMGHTLEDEFDQIYLKHDDFQSERATYLWIEEGNGDIPEIRSVLTDERILPDVFTQNGISGDDVWRTVLLTCFHKYERNGNRVDGFREVLRRVREEASASNGVATKLGAIVPELEMALETVGERLFFPYMADIVADTICADYLDYMQRDPRNLGLDVLSDDRVISHFWIGQQKNVGLRMALALEDKRGKPRLDTTTGVVDLVRQRYRFAEIVYYHKTKAAASVMFATALRLLEKSNFPECPPLRRFTIEPGGASRTLTDLTNGSLPLDEFVKRATPRALLDPEVGDETLMLLMQQKAIDTVREMIPGATRERGAKSAHRERAHKSLRALSLLQNLARRKLHKVVFALDALTWLELFRGSGTLASDDLDDRIKDLRTDDKRRAAIEHGMQAALADAGQPEAGDDCLLLYVPARKSQAKGIETGALDSGDVITLGQHRTVRAQVAELGQKYSSLWRLLVFANPQVRNPVALSRAIDFLLKELVPKLDPAAYQGYDALAKACWFKYIGADLATAGQLYRQIPTTAERSFELALARSTSSHSLSDEEIAARTAILDALLDADLTSSDAQTRIKIKFKKDGAAVSALQSRSDVADLFKAKKGKNAKAVQDAIDRIAHELTQGGLALVPKSIARRGRRPA